MKLKPVWLVLVAFSVLSCSTSQFGWKTEPEPEKEGTRKTGYVEDFDPLTLQEDEIEVRPIEETPTFEESQEDISESIPSGELALNEKEMVQGFRVQLLATTDENQARDAKKRAIFRFQTGVYLVFEAPHYKLRIGDCITRKEAEDLRKEASRSGFQDAWIVPSKVYQLKDESSNL
jgi:hypothetical protein